MRNPLFLVFDLLYRAGWIDGKSKSDYLVVGIMAMASFLLVWWMLRAIKMAVEILLL